jgi:hypothetical protein
MPCEPEFVRPVTEWTLFPEELTGSREVLEEDITKSSPGFMPLNRLVFPSPYSNPKVGYLADAEAVKQN